MLKDGVVNGFGHGQQTRGRVGHVQALNVKLQGDRTNVGMEIERGICRAAQPTLDEGR